MGAVILTVVRSDSPEWLDVLVVVDDESLDRMKQRDPFEVDLASVANRHNARHRSQCYPRSLGVVWASAEDLGTIVALTKQGKVSAAIAYACRGWEKKPEDHDAGPVSVRDAKDPS